MVAPYQSNPVRISHLVGEQEQEHLHAVVAPVHVIAHEQVVAVRDVAPHSEQLAQVEQLTMDVPAHRHWSACDHRRWQ